MGSNLYTTGTRINTYMTIVTEEEGIKLLLDSVANTEYRPTSSYTACKDYTSTYTTRRNKDYPFIVDTSLDYKGPYKPYQQAHTKR